MTTKSRKTTKPSATKKPIAKKAATKANGKIAATAGRKFSGKKLFPSAEVKKANPRRADSWGYNSLEIIRRSPGLTYEEFLRSGGRHRDLNWDAARGRVEARA